MEVLCQEAVKHVGVQASETWTEEIDGVQTIIPPGPAAARALSRRHPVASVVTMLLAGSNFPGRTGGDVPEGLRPVRSPLGNDAIRHNVNVNAVCPGIVDGPRMKKLCEEKAMVRGWTEEEVYDEYVQDMALKRVATAQDVANAVLFLASDDARQITGQHIAVDGGRDV